MKAVIYARTAVKPQPQDDDKIQTQIEACRQYAKENGLDVVEVFSDAGSWGARLDRPALTRMRQLIARDALGEGRRSARKGI